MSDLGDTNVSWLLTYLMLRIKNNTVAMPSKTLSATDALTYCTLQRKHPESTNTAKAPLEECDSTMRQ